MEQLLDAVFELVGLVLADVLEPRPIVVERAVLHGGFELGIIEPIELEHEEQKMGRRRRHALLHVGIEFSACRIDGVAGMDEAGIGRQPPHHVVDRFVALHRGGEPRAAAVFHHFHGELAFVGGLERRARDRQ